MSAKQQRLFDQVDDPFAVSAIPASADERAIAELIWPHKGRGNPVALKDLCRLHETGEREIKAIIERLRRDHGLRIGASRKLGYFVIQDAEDAEVALKPFRRQIFTMLKTFRRLATPSMFRELSGQLQLELDGRKDDS